MIDKIKKATKNPSNIHHISWITKTPEDEIQVIVEDLLEKGILQESHYAKGYYKWVSNKEEK